MRVVVEMSHSNPDWDNWFIDFPEVEDSLPLALRPTTEDGCLALARDKAEAMSDSNGGDWKFVAFHDRLPHEQ